jgi:hypothetical protein
MPLVAGISSIVITPPVGVELAGYSFGASQGILEDLEAHVLLLTHGPQENDQGRLVLITADLLTFGAEFTARVRRRVEAETGIPGGQVILAASHTHSGPTTVHFRQWGLMDEAYVRSLEDALVGAVRMARNNLKEARLGWGCGKVESIGENRRGKAVLDPAVPLLRVDDLDGKARVVLMNYACHPVSLHSYRNLFSPDYPGYMRQVMKEVLGKQVTVLFTLGTAGDINPKGYRPRTFTPERSRWMGKILGCEAAKVALESAPEILAAPEVLAVPGAENPVEAELRVASQKVELPVVPLPSATELETLHRQFCERIEQLNQAGEGWEEIARWEIQREWAEDGLREWQAGGVRSSVTCEITAARLGGMRFLAAPMELFSETGLAIKAAFPGETVLICSNANGALGYLPTQDAYLEQDYTNPEGLAPRVYGLYALAEEAEGVFRQEAVRLLSGV